MTDWTTEQWERELGITQSERDNALLNAETARLLADEYRRERDVACAVAADALTRTEAVA